MAGCVEERLTSSGIIPQHFLEQNFKEVELDVRDTILEILTIDQFQPISNQLQNYCNRSEMSSASFTIESSPCFLILLAHVDTASQQFWTIFNELLRNSCGPKKQIHLSVMNFLQVTMSSLSGLKKFKGILFTGIYNSVIFFCFFNSRSLVLFSELMNSYC